MIVLSRIQFKELVFKRSGGRCVFCKEAAVDPHHIFDRKLFPDTGGYFLSNGAGVCALHHWDCEMTLIAVEDVRIAAGIEDLILPESLVAGRIYDKWGNSIRSDGSRCPGPLFQDVGAKRALAAGGKLGLFYGGDYYE